MKGISKAISTCVAATFLISSTAIATPVYAADVEDQYVTLDGDWNFKLYRTYKQMFQYFAYTGVQITWEDNDLAQLPDEDTWSEWETVQMPADDVTTGGLLPLEDADGEALFPSWSEAWVCRTFELPDNFTEDEEVTLLLGIVDDMDAVYINGQLVAGSGWKDGNGNITLDIPETGGFDYTNEDPEKQVQFEKSYWEVSREYKIPTDCLNLDGENEICIRIYNNNGFGGFYSGNVYALCGSESAVRYVKGLPTDEADEPDLIDLVNDQNKYLMDLDRYLDDYADTIYDDYHNDAEDKDAKIQAAKDLAASGSIVIEDTNPVVYEGEDDCYWYSAHREITCDGDVISSEDVEICYILKRGQFYERGNWNRCYTTSYDSDLFDKELKYSIYLPPSYYTNSNKEYPVVYLLHGINSTSESFVKVDGIADFMDEEIDDGDITEMIVVMPDSGKNAFYRDTEYDPAKADSTGPWMTHLTTEIREQVEENYRILKNSDFRGLTGISMGGFGAVNVGTSHPELYSSIASHMGAIGYLNGTALESLESLSSEQLKNYDFYLDCGYQDTMVDWQDTERMHEYLDSMGIEHGFDLRDGGHNSAFYMAGMPYSMKMHSDHFVKNGYGYVPPSDSDSSSDSETDYAISTESSDNGSYELSTDRAERGDTVTITVDPDEGYVLDRLIITDRNGDRITVKSEGNNKYSFVMPTGKINVEAIFVLAEEEEPEEPVIPEQPQQPESLPFGDVATSDYYYDAVAWAVENGVTAGTSDTTFGPNDSCSRAQTVTFLWRAAGSPAPQNTTNPFTDVSTSDYYYNAVLWAVENGITSGTSATTFGSNDICNRAQVVTFLYRYSKETASASAGFTDVAADAYYSSAVQWAAQNGITSGTTATTFAPDDNCTRGQIVTFLYRHMVK